MISRPVNRLAIQVTEPWIPFNFYNVTTLHFQERVES